MILVLGSLCACALASDDWRQKKPVETPVGSESDWRAGAIANGTSSPVRRFVECDLPVILGISLTTYPKVGIHRTQSRLDVRCQ